MESIPLVELAKKECHVDGRSFDELGMEVARIQEEKSELLQKVHLQSEKQRAILLARDAQASAKATRNTFVLILVSSLFCLGSFPAILASLTVEGWPGAWLVTMPDGSHVNVMKWLVAHVFPFLMYKILAL